MQALLLCCSTQGRAYGVRMTWPMQSVLTLPMLVTLQTTKGAADGQTLWQSDGGLCLAAQLDTCDQFSSCINTTFSISVAEGVLGILGMSLCPHPSCRHALML